MLRDAVLFTLAGGGMLAGGLAWADPVDPDEKAGKGLLIGFGGLLAVGGVAILSIRYPRTRASRRDERQRTRLQLDQLMVTSERAHAGVRLSF
jgi:hypothetical protein